jgi:translation elongation factor EF-G
MPHDVAKQPLLVDVGIEAKSRSDHERLVLALGKLAAEDPPLVVLLDEESGQIILRGTSEDHLKSKLDVLDRIHGIDANVGALQVALRERPTRRAEVEHTHKKIFGPKGEFAAIRLVVEPNEPGKGYQFECKASGNALPTEYLPGIEKGLDSVLACGVTAGFPVVDVKVQVIDGKYHDVDSSPRAFEIAARAAFRDGLALAELALLEPIMKVEVVTPAQFAKSIVNDLKSRRGSDHSEAIEGDTVAIGATVPLVTMFGYANSLRIMSDGRATYTMRFDHYGAVPCPEDDPPLRPAIGMRA